MRVVDGDEDTKDEVQGIVDEEVTNRADDAGDDGLRKSWSTRWQQENPEKTNFGEKRVDGLVVRRGEVIELSCRHDWAIVRQGLDQTPADAVLGFLAGSRDVSSGRMGRSRTLILVHDVHAARLVEDGIRARVVADLLALRVLLAPLDGLLCRLACRSASQLWR